MQNVVNVAAYFAVKPLRSQFKHPDVPSFHYSDYSLSRRNYSVGNSGYYSQNFSFLDVHFLRAGIRIYELA